jgi:hypothetical protein
MMGISEQKHLWMLGYGVLGLCFLGAGALSILRHEAQQSTATTAPKITRTQALSWVILAAIPSSLMLGLTSYVTTDIAAISLFWVVPLGLYLLTFILVFGAASRLPLRWITFALATLLLLLVCVNLMIPLHGFTVLGFHVAYFFLMAWFFHGHLAQSKPETGRLTEFYLWMSLGGMLGGLFNAVIAPMIFTLMAEYYMVAFISIALVAVLMRQPVFDAAFFLRKAAVIIPLALATALLIDLVFSGLLAGVALSTLYIGGGIIGLGCILLVAMKKMHPKYLSVASGAIIGVVVAMSQLDSDVLIQQRSFYGSMNVTQSVKVNPETGEEQTTHSFSHGTTTHGVQVITPETEQKIPRSYYHQSGLFGDIAQGYLTSKSVPVEFAMVGLGTGALTAYARPGDAVSVYEIDQKVIDIARNQVFFKHLSLSPATTRFIVGDARLKLQEAADSSYDALFIDAFSSDAVPVHLLTQEAINLYLLKTKATGAIAIHISNRYLALKPVIAGYTLPAGYAAYCGDSGKRETKDEHAARHILCLITQEDTMPAAIKNDPAWEKLSPQPGFTPWTDDFSNIYSVFKWRAD